MIGKINEHSHLDGSNDRETFDHRAEGQAYIPYKPLFS